ncbi:MAG: hypothetical protein ACJ780_01250 [Solirubrobacteraceae bacterium]
MIARAVALAGSGSGASSHNSAASGHYKPGKGCGDKNHHTSKGQAVPAAEKEARYAPKKHHAPPKKHKTSKNH